MTINDPLLSESDDSDCTYELVTGANSGLGFAICCRLIDEFIATRPNSQRLRLIITTRDGKKSESTVRRLNQHLARHPKKAQTRISFQPERLDLTSLHSVRLIAQKLVYTLPKIDSILLNAGFSGFTGVNWPLAIWSVLTNLVAAVTYPTFKLSGVGFTTSPQIVDNDDLSNGARIPHPPLAEVFCANVFGHYLLAHQLMPLLSQPTSAGRIIWISSIEAHASTLSLADMQGLHASHAYESSKRLTDLLALTFHLPSTRPFVSCFLSPPRPSQPPLESPSPANMKAPKMYVAHPGICATGIMPLPFILYVLMTAVFYVARWLGSPWHPIRAYKGACAPTWLALSSDDELYAVSQEHSRVGPEMHNDSGGGWQPRKWGSGTDRTGRERVLMTAVEGQGEDEWGELGRRCWAQMERLREEWEDRLGHAGAGGSARGRGSPGS
ncbi:3-keto-steroid reductase [Pseudocyphellaria aurata]|nr:3-keto-steroid reductase [Pseudocyphellaria aurata]